MNPLVRKFLFAGVENIPANTDAISDPLLFEHQKYHFNVWPSIVIAIVGTPTFTIQCSEDGVEFRDYIVKAQNVSVLDTVEKSYFSYKYMRIKHTAVDATEGEVNYIVTHKLR